MALADPTRRGLTQLSRRESTVGPIEMNPVSKKQRKKITVDIIHRIGFKSQPAQVYEAVTSLKGLAHWWTEEVRGDGKPGGRIEFTFRTPIGELKALAP